MPQASHDNTQRLPQGFNPGESGIRVMSVDRIDKENRTIELSFSSEIEVKRWGGVEILDHSEGAVDLSRLNASGPLLFNHELDDVLGVVEKAWIDKGGKGRALVRFSRRPDAELAWQDVQDGILRNVSVGYRINEVKLKETRDDGNTDVYLVTKWEPYEISIVTAPADPSVGIGRNINQTQTNNRSLMNREQMIAWLSARGITVDASISDVDLVRKIETYKPADPAPAAPPAFDPVAAAQRGRIQVGEDYSRGATEERARVAAITKAGNEYGIRELAEKAITEGKSISDFREIALEAVNKRNQQVKDSTTPLGLTDKEARGFSFRKLMLALTSPAGEAKRDAEDAAFELEVCQAAADKMQHRSAKGLVLPLDVLAAVPLAGKRGTDIVSIKTGSGYSGTGGNTVQTQLLSQSFIDILRNRTTIMQLGTELSGLVGNIDIPRQTTGASASWIGEDADSTQEDVDFDLVSLRPKTVTNFMEVTRKMLMQSSLGIEALLRRELASGLALQMDLKGFYGTGLSDTPTGIKATSGINSFYWATDNVQLFTELVRMETEIASDNADVPSMAYVTNPAIRGYLKGVRKIATATDSNTIWEPGNTINGYRTEITNQVAAGDVFFGNWADLLIGMWGGLDLTVDPYTHSKKGRVRIVAFQDVDFTVRRAASFCYAGNDPA